MILTIYNNKSDIRVVDKNITKICDYNAMVMRDQFNVRGDVVTVKGGIINLYNFETNAIGKIISPTTGEPYPNSLYNTSDFIKVGINDIITISYDAISDRTASNYIGIYDNEYNFLNRSSFRASSGLVTINKTGAIDGYIKISFNTIYCDTDYVMVNKGLKAEPFMPYGDIDLKFANYCYIDELQRYYYIIDVNAISYNMWELTLKCDVLMTFKEGIRNLVGTVDRQQNKYNGYIPDNQYKELAYTQITAKTFPNSMNNDSLILMTVG